MDTIRNVLLIFIVVLLFAACSSPVQQEEATLTLHFGVAGARAVYPPDAAILAKLEHTITLVGPGDTITRTFEPGVISANIEIVTGTWKITVVAYLQEGSKKVLYAAGSKTVTITEGINNVTVKMYGDESSEDFIFEVIADGPNKGTARIRGNGWLEGDIIIPGYYKDGANFLPVTEIGSDDDGWGSGAFSECDDLTSITIPASVVSIGAYAFEQCYSLETVTFASGSRLESIGYGAFMECNNLTAITIPGDVTSIGESAFWRCLDLKTIAFAPGSRLESIGEYAFSHCGFASITIPASVTKIYRNAFWFCFNLTEITIPASITSIGDEAFYWCESLKTITFAPGSMLESIGNEAFADCTNLNSITIPAGVKAIGGYAFGNCDKLANVIFAQGSIIEIIDDYSFADCTGLANITIPTGVKDIGAGAFWRCESLQSVTLPQTVKIIQSGAFSGCEKLTSINIPEGVKDIQWGVFTNCTSLQSIIIPASVEYIGPAFDGCTSLTNITVSPGNPSYSTDAGGGPYLYREIYSGSNTKELAAYPSATGNVTTLPLSVTTIIGSNAFYDQSITGINLTGITEIHYGAFAGCSDLTNITLPNTLERLDGDVFNCCTSLVSINIPDSITEIYRNPFTNCTSLTGITLDNPASAKFETDGRILYYKFNDDPDGMDDPVYAEKKLVAYPTVSSSFTIPADVTLIGEYAFFNCEALTTVIFAANSKLKKINDRAFESCYNLTNPITFPASLEAIDAGVFSLCEKLTGVNFAVNGIIERIDTQAFYGCISIASITIPTSVTFLGCMVFYGWTPTQTITIRGKANQAAADAAWIEGQYTDYEGIIFRWRDYCEANIVYTL